MRMFDASVWARNASSFTKIVRALVLANDGGGQQSLAFYPLQCFYYFTSSRWTREEVWELKTVICCRKWGRATKMNGPHFTFTASTCQSRGTWSEPALAITQKWNKNPPLAREFLFYFWRAFLSPSRAHLNLNLTQKKWPLKILLVLNIFEWFIRF